MLMSRVYCNPHSHSDQAQDVDNIRNMVLEHFNTNMEEYSVVFTSGMLTYFNTKII